MTATPSDLVQAREQFLGLVESVRPDLHRYASRLMGSAIDGEDVVQETLAKAFYAMTLSPELPELRPWLFRIARNTAIDQLRRHERKNEVLPEGEPMTTDELGRDPEVIRAALSSFVSLPVSQRSAVILKDVLGESLEDIAAHLETSVEAVKALLVRGREKLKASQDEARAKEASARSPEQRALLHRYVALFNDRDWQGLQSMLLDEVRLDLVSKSQRQGKAVGMYFGRYEKETDLVFRAISVEGRDAIGVYRRDADALLYVILLEIAGDRISFIKDFRYVPYMAGELALDAT